MASELKVDGYDAILQKLSQVETDLQERVAKGALLEGAKAIQQAIVEEVRVSHRNEVHLREDIQVSKATRTEAGWVVKIGPGKKTAWRAKFLELGHSKSGGGKVPAYPFMEPGLKRSQDGFVRNVGDYVKKELHL